MNRRSDLRIATVFSVALIAMFLLPTQSLSASALTDPHLRRLVESSDQVLGVEILVAGPKNDEPASRFGHAVLRFVMEGSDAFSDPVIAFVADTPNGDQSYLKGLFGRYRSTVVVASLSAFYLSYLNVQDRPVSRYVLPTNSLMRKNLINDLVRLVSLGDELENYWFIGKNCTDLLLAFLSRAGIQLRNPPLAIPSLLGDVMTSELLTALPPLKTFEPIEERKKINGTLDFESLPTLQLQRLFYSLNRIGDFKLRSDLFHILKNRRNAVALEKVYNLESLPQVIYELCLDQCNVHGYQHAVHQFFSKSSPRHLASGSRELKRTSQLADSRRRLEQPHARHFRLTLGILCEANVAKSGDVSNACPRLSER